MFSNSSSKNNATISTPLFESSNSADTRSQEDQRISTSRSSDNTENFVHSSIIQKGDVLASTNNRIGSSSILHEIETMLPCPNQPEPFLSSVASSYFALLNESGGYGTATRPHSAQNPFLGVSSNHQEMGNPDHSNVISPVTCHDHSTLPISEPCSTFEKIDVLDSCKSKPFRTLSFHQTKEVVSAEGGRVAEHTTKCRNLPPAQKSFPAVRFRCHQAENWMGKFEELLDFRLKNGHCLVPNAFKENPSLAEWVKRQRYQFKLRELGQRSTMSDDRVSALKKIGFVWNSHDQVWEERLKDLKAYRNLFHDCYVPSNYAPNPQLAIWVKRQRRQYKFLKEGKTSTMTSYRIDKLNGINFAWSGRQCKKPRPMSARNSGWK